MAVKEDLSSRVNTYNAQVKSLLAKVNEANAKVEYSKKEFEKGCNLLAKELGREVNADNLESICEEIENSIKEQVTLGEQLIERANAQLGNTSVQQVPSQSDVQQTPNIGTGVGTGVGAGVGSGVQQTPNAYQQNYAGVTMPTNNGAYVGMTEPSMLNSYPQQSIQQMPQQAPEYVPNTGISGLDAFGSTLSI